MFYLYCTKKLLDRIKPEISLSGRSDTSLGNWYATALFWKPQIALLVSERTLLPLLIPLAPDLRNGPSARSQSHSQF
ncbi:DUF6933 domain-containing protein [Novosphingobium mathurense]|uniref:DUF6933 domain-containing protein n=1 Tax=Novosphingobium mathurense TaxID=428990 RepID=UPI003CCC0ECC